MAAPSSGRVVSSFQKKGQGKGIQIAGTRPSLHNGQLLLSTGIPSLDHILGGGVAVGTILLIEEDVYTSFARLMLKYFVAEGVMCGHYSFLSSLDPNPDSLLTELPCPVESALSTSQNVQPPGEVKKGHGSSSGSSEKTVIDKGSHQGNMEIAWRYQNLPQLKTELATSPNIFGHVYDLTKTMPGNKIDKEKLWCYQHCQTSLDQETTSSPEDYANSDTNAKFDHLLNEIKRVINITGCNLQTVPNRTTSSSATKNILRLALLSLGSPLWGDIASAEGNAAICQFLHQLRATTRKSLAACTITVPTHLFQQMYSRRIERLCDYVVRLESFAGEDKAPAFKEYHGLFHVVQIPRLNCLANYALDTEDLAFKLKRKKFSIEKIHLPPDLSETVSRSQGEHLKTAKGCGGGGTSNTSLDF
ncbi:elongator complex protein 4-like [Antedon mediterranea]|uniref:elongator complex protein 4-like n=1 Tax=Antedon mediterranea TaxID=105859 RepID=UPI003AF66FAF